MTTWVYWNSEPGLWTVGHYTPDGSREPESDHATPEAAAARVHYLNGGAGTINADLLAALEDSERLLEALRIGYPDIAADTRVSGRCKENNASIAAAKETK